VPLNPKSAPERELRHKRKKVVRREKMTATMAVRFDAKSGAKDDRTEKGSFSTIQFFFPGVVKLAEENRGKGKCKTSNLAARRGVVGKKKGPRANVGSRNSGRTDRLTAKGVGGRRRVRWC